MADSVGLMALPSTLCQTHLQTLLLQVLVCSHPTWNICVRNEMADSVGFEPTKGRKTPYHLSRVAPSAARPTVRSACKMPFFNFDVNEFYPCIFKNAELLGILLYYGGCSCLKRKGAEQK